MDQAHTLTLDQQIYLNNLAALKLTHPLLAERIDCPFPSDSQAPILSATRDGHLNFRLTQDDGCLQWFGRTSIPAVRAEALLKQFQAGQANVMLPGIGEGTEAVRLAQQIGIHRAVFVWETDQTAVQLMLRLHDVAGLITDRRLIFLICPLERLTTTLIKWLEENPGHLCPNRIMMWPWQTPNDLVACRMAVEQAFHQIESRREQQLMEIRQKISSSADADISESVDLSIKIGESGSPVVPVMALLAQDQVWAVVDGLCTGASAMDWTPIKLDVRSPADIHPVKRATQLLDTAKNGIDFAILIHHTRNEVREVLPDDIPVISWLGHPAVLDEHLLRRTSVKNFIAVSGTWMADRAAEFGLDKDHLFVCPPPCLADLEHDCDLESGARPVDVAIIADLYPIDAESYGYQLPTYKMIWQSAVDLIAARIESFNDSQVDTLLRRAEDKAKTRIENPGIRRDMILALTTRVAHSLIWRNIVQVLVNNNIKYELYGNGWTGVPGVKAAGTAINFEKKKKIFRESKMIIHADVTGEITTDALLAAGCGAVVLTRRHPRDQLPGGVAAVFQNDCEILNFSNKDGVIEAISRLLGEDELRKRIALQARQKCASDLSPEAWLKSLRAAATSFFTGRD